MRDMTVEVLERLTRIEYVAYMDTAAILLILAVLFKIPLSLSLISSGAILLLGKKITSFSFLKFMFR